MARAIDTMPTFSNKKNTQTTSGTTAQTTRAVDAMPTFTGKTVSVTTADTSKSSGNLDTMPTFSGKTTTPTAAQTTQTEDSGFDLGKFLIGSIAKGGNAIAKAGSSTLSFLERSILEPLFPGITENTPIQDLNKGVDEDAVALESTFGENRDKGGKAAKVAEDVISGTIQAIPQAVAAVSTAGTSLAAQGLSGAAATSPTVINTVKSAVSGMAKNPNYWTSFLTTLGNDYESAKADGADDTHAGLYAVVDSLLNAAVEVGGGIQTLPTELQGNRFTIHKWIDSMVEEGKEEVVQGVISRGLENMVYDKGNALASLSDEDAILNPVTSAKEFGMGAAVGGILGGAQGLVSNAVQKAAGDAAGAQTAAQESNVTTPAQNAAEGAQAASQAGIMEQEAARLFGQNNTAPETGTVVYRRNYDPIEAAAIRKVSKKFSNVVAGADTSISDFFSKWKNGRKSHLGEPLEKLYIGKVTDAARSKMSELLGYDVQSTDYIITADNVKHIIDQHGNAAQEIQRGNLPLDTISMDMIADVVENPDRITLGDTENWEAARDGLQFEKNVGNGTVIYVQFDNFKRGTMEPRTLYIKKKGVSPSTVNAANATNTYTPEVIEPETPNSDFTITRGAENVKTQGQNDSNVLYTKNNEDIHQLLSNGVQFPKAMADDILARKSIPQNEAERNSDILSKILFGDSRVDLNSLSSEQQNEVFRANEAGTVGMDAEGRVFQIDPAQHIDQRSSEDVSSRKVKAFQFDHPQLHQYYKSAAETLLLELNGAQPGGQTQSATGEYGQTYSWRTKRSVSPRVETLLDEGGMSYARIESALDAIIHDKGQENYADAKRVELVLDNMLTNGYNDGSGQFVPANDAYIEVKDQIAGSASAERGHALDGLGAANAGSLNSDFQNLQAQSDTFHPEGANAARPVDVPTTNLEGRNIPKSAATVMGAQGINENDVRLIEQQIADGTLAFDTIKDADAVSRAHQTILLKGFDGALEQYRQAANANVATKDNATLGQQLLLQASRDGNEAAVSEILTLYTRNSTTAAQAMQAQSIFRKLSPEGQLLSVKRALNDLNSKYGTDVQLTEAEISDFLNADGAAARQKVQEQILKRAAQSVPGTFRAKYDTLRYLGMLGNPRTHIRNILGNTMFQVPVMAKNRVGAVAEYAANRASGGKVERTKSITGANPFGKLAAEARADWKNAKGFLEQSSKYSEGQASLSAIEQHADAFSNENIVGRTINRLSNTNSALLEAEDTAAKKFIYSQSLASYLKANGVKSIEDADTGLLYRARNYAAQEALRNTFNDHNVISDAASELGNLSRSDNVAKKAAGYVVEGILPFKRTPTNIAVRAVEYSPVGAVLGAVEAGRGAKGGDMTQAVRGLDRVAAGLSGTALMAAGCLAAGAGYVTGGKDEDDKQQDFDDLTGHQTYALELKDGTSVTLDWLAPEAISFFMGVELFNAAIDGGLTLDNLWGILRNVSAPMLEMSMLQGLNDTVNDAAYAVNRGDSVLASLAISALTNYMTQVIPTLGGQIERVGETERMTTYTDKNSSIPTDWQYTIGKVSQKVPGWDYQQIPYIDAWGRTEETGSEAERIFNNFFNPAYVSQADVDKVEQELQRVKDATGDSNVFPKRADRAITVNGETKNLTADEYQKYAKALGQGSYTLVKDGLSLPAYQSMSDTEKADYISSLYKYAAQTAKEEVSDYEPDSWVGNAKTAQQDIGVSTAEYIALYEKYGSDIMSGKSYDKTKQAVSAGLTVAQWADMKGGIDADGNGSVSQAEAEAYLNGQSFSNSTKADLWTIINKSWKKNPYA